MIAVPVEQLGSASEHNAVDEDETERVGAGKLGATLSSSGSVLFDVIVRRIL